MKVNGRLIVFTVILVALQTACKYFFSAEPGWSGVSPFLAIALFSGFIIKERNMSFLLPLAALLISDAIIHVLYLNGQFVFPGLYGGQWKNYAILLAVTLIGWTLKGRSRNSLIVGGIAAPTLFFLVSNFMVWQAASEAFYPKTFSGLMTCYEAGLPFYRNSLIATAVFLPVILVSYNYITRKKAELVLG